MKALIDFAAALCLLAALPAFATVGKRHRLAHQPSARTTAPRSQDRGLAVSEAGQAPPSQNEPLVHATTRPSPLTAWTTFAPTRI